MRRALFLREFRTALLPNLAAAFYLVGFLAYLDFSLSRGNPEIRTFFLLGLFAGLVGYISGERCFPSDLKEYRTLFLHSLPISRTRSWIDIILARLLAGLIALAPIAAFQLVWLPEGQQPHFALLPTSLLFIYILSFSAGSLFALLFRRPLFAYVAGLGIFSVLWGETFLSCRYAAESPSVAFAHLPKQWIGSPHPSIVAFLILLLVLSFTLSWRFFVEGEIGNLKRWGKNHLLFGMTAVAYLGVVVCATSSKRLSMVGSTWNLEPMSAGPSSFGPHSVSRDGHYLAVFEALDGRPFVFRVSLVDVRTGRLTGQSVFSGIYRAYWSGVGRGEALNLIVLNNSPLDRWGYLLPATLDWVQLSPKANEISKKRIPGVRNIELMAEGRALAVEEEDGVGKVLILDGTQGASSEVVRAPFDGYASIDSDGFGALVYFVNDLPPRRAWFIGSNAHEVHIPQTSMRTALVLFDTIPGSPAEAQNLLLEKFPPPVGPGGTPTPGEFILPYYSFWTVESASETKGLFFLEKSNAAAWNLWARSTATEGHWERLSDISPEVSRRLATPARASGNFIDLALGTGAFPTKAGAGSVLFYDPQLGISHEASGCASESKAVPSVSRITGLKGSLITLVCRDSSSSQTETHYFEHRLGMPVRPIKTVLGLDAVLLYLDEEGVAVWETSDGKIWRSAPGSQDLRLWVGKRLPPD
jgi:hypothetical protein